MALLKENEDGTKSGYKRPRHIQQAMSRSINWENRTHHFDADTGIAVRNDELTPVNASQAAHDRMTLRVYAQKMEKEWFKQREFQLAKEKTIEGLKEELARVQKLPELDWAQASSEFMQHLASLARGGEQPRAKAAVATLDKLKVYVDRKIAELEIAERNFMKVQEKRNALELRLKEGVCYKCRERERIMASLPQDGSRGQKDAWDEMLDRISTLEHERDAAQNEINKLDERLKSSREQNSLRGRHLTILENKLTELGVDWRRMIHESQGA